MDTTAPTQYLEPPVLTEEDLVDVHKEPGDILDVPDPLATGEQLDKLKEMIDNMPREKMIELLGNLMGDGGNPVNPNKNIYSSSSKEDMIRNRFHQKLYEKQMTIKPQHIREHKQKQRYEEYMTSSSSASSTDTPSSSDSIATPNQDHH